jgi:hypothetical protein
MRLTRLLALAVPLLIAISAAPAQAGIGTWNSLPGLNDATGPSWVREYATGVPPTTIYAATEGDGVYRSLNDGLTWSSFSSGLDAAAMNVRTVFSDGTTMYAGTTSGLFKSIAGGSWQPVAQGPEDDPKNPKKLNVPVQTVLTGLGGQMLAGVASGGVYKSSDGGATWKPPAPDNGMARSETVWSMGTLIPGVIFAATSSGIYRSINFGTTWTLASDGISGTTLKVFADGHNPNIFYAATPGSGVYRSINAGITWSAINGTGSHQLGNYTVRDMHQFFGVNETRLYVATANGMYAGTTSNGPIPGAVSWRKVTNDGLGNNTIFWALTNFTTTPGTMLAGTQSNGGYALTFTPPAPIAGQPPTINPKSPVQSQLLSVTSNGGWTGTQTIEFEYQWQRCSGAVCSDIADATTSTYLVPETATKYAFRVVVTGKNDFPTFGLATANSAITSVSTANPATLPGANQSSIATITDVIPGEDITLPQSGDTLKAVSWVFNPAAATVGFQWFSCDSGGANCDPVAGATTQSYMLTDADVGHRLCVKVTGTNVGGSFTLNCSGTTNEVFPQEATQLVKAKVIGSAYVGDTLVSDVGTWKYPGTTYTRQWEQCEADGTGCSTISGAKSSTYKITGDDLGQTLRVRISADSNGANKFPAPVEALTAVTAVVTNAPVPEPDPIPQGGGNGGGGNGGGGNGGGGNGGGGGGNGTPTPDVTAPVLQSLGAVSAKLKPGAQLKLKVGVTEGGTLSVDLQRVRAGRKVGKKCKAGAHKGKKCTVISKIATVKLGVGGSGIVALPKRKLAAGDYRAVVTPIDAAGNRGAAKTISFKVTKK